MIAIVSVDSMYYHSHKEFKKDSTQINQWRTFDLNNGVPEPIRILFKATHTISVWFYVW